MNIGIYICDQAEVLDFSGSFGVLGVANRLGNLAWNVWVAAEEERSVEARRGFPVMPHYSIQNVPELDVLIVVGGVHSAELGKKAVIDWIRKTAKETQITGSVFTGAFLLAEAGLLDGLEVTTHWEDILDLQKNYPRIQVREGIRWIEQGQLIAAAGISARIDMSLELLSKFAGVELAAHTARKIKCTLNRITI